MVVGFLASSFRSPKNKFLLVDVSAGYCGLKSSEELNSD